MRPSKNFGERAIARTLTAALLLFAPIPFGCGEKDAEPRDLEAECYETCPPERNECLFRCAAVAECGQTPYRLTLNGRQELQGVSFPWDEISGVSIGGPIGIYVPEDVYSIALSAEDSVFTTALDGVSMDGLSIFELGTRIPEFVSTPGTVGGVVIPNRPTLQPIGARCIIATAYTTGGASRTPGRLHVFPRYQTTGETLRVRAVRVDRAEISDDQIRQVIEGTNAIYVPAGTPRLELTQIVDYTHGFEVRVDIDESIGELRAADIGAAAEEIAIFFVDNVGTPGILGLASAIPGPLGVQRSAGSGVVISVEDHFLDPEAGPDLVVMTSTVAHELGHQMGLFHTTEFSGAGFDPLPDTTQCSTSFDTNNDRVLSASECEGQGASNLMFWQSSSEPQTELTPSQADVLVRSPIIR
jgi:hypothetical protein